MFGQLDALYSILIIEGLYSEALDLLCLVKEAGSSKIISDYEEGESMGRSGEGRQSMSPEKREFLWDLIEAILTHLGKSLDTVNGTDFVPSGLKATRYTAIAIDLLRNPDIKAVADQYNFNMNIKIMYIMKAISFIAMDIVKKMYLKNPSIPLKEAKERLAERGFLYSTITAVRFLKLAPDYQNIYLVERDFEDASESFLLRYAEKLAEQDPEAPVTAKE